MTSRKDIPREAYIAATARIVQSICPAMSPSCATAWLLGSIDAVPDTITFLQPGVRTSAAREKLEPYSRAGHCSGLGSASTSTLPGLLACTAKAPTTILSPELPLQPIPVDAGTYRPFIAKQVELTRKKDAIAEDNELYAQESAWMDAIRPLEFAEAQAARENGDHELAILRTVEGIARLYSDEAIEKALQDLENVYPKATRLLEGYRKLTEIRDTSGADEKSLENLRKKRDAWQEDLLAIEQ